MLNNFSPDYKKTLLESETFAKKQGYKYLEDRDILLQILKIKNGHLYDVFMSFGLNEKLLRDVLLKPEFILLKRDGVYSGISKMLNETIVSSVKIAASFQKPRASLEDFLLALIQKSSWFTAFLDYVGIWVKDFEQSIVHINNFHSQKNISGFESLGKMLSMLEKGMFTGGDIEEFEQIPMEESLPFEETKKSKKDSKTPALDFFCFDLSKEAKNKNIENIIGRDQEIERLISILNRKTKNNPCLVGEPGVGKTAIVEGLALRIFQNDVPFAMKNKRILLLDMASIVAGTKYRGEFEVRMKQIIEEASQLDNEVILFIDEIHTIIGAGGTEWALDAANILKPAMGRWKIRIIGATTFSEYQKYIEKDSALERRFQKIDVWEPDKDTAQEIISGIKNSFEDYHNLIIEESAIQESIELSTRYINDRFLPDKAIDIIDEACSLKSMKYDYNEWEIEDLKKKIEKMQKNIDNFVISQQYEKAAKLKKEIQILEKKITEKRKKISIPRSKRYKITERDIQSIIHSTYNVPLQNLSTEEKTRLKQLPTILKKHIIGQDEAIKNISSSIRRSRVGITDKNRPIGSFLFLGPTGVGKTELVKVLAKEFYGDEKSLIKIDMSEFQEKSSASKLIGTSAGYIGYEEGGMLTEQVRRKPYSIVLFDEIEKANLEIYNLLLQILEDGYITDGKGRKVNFRNTILILTSNIGSEEFNTKAQQIGFKTSEDEKQEALKDFSNTKEKIISELNNYFSPEFINRIDKTIVFNPLEKKSLKKIAQLHMNQLQFRLRELGIILEYDLKILSKIIKETFNPEFGARPIRRYIQSYIEDLIAEKMLSKKFTKIFLDIKKDEFIIEFDWKKEK